ncbi:MAG: hypothetical protein Ct9H300mP27_08370 [Chloroflexota bacterium]|nr:MAG: hypothetical protein Ct9H300mP27_08370 [Chloroflexota bacterium]
MESIFADQTSANLSDRQKAIFNFANKLSSTQSEWSEADVLALVERGAL